MNTRNYRRFGTLCSATGAVEACDMDLTGVIGANAWAETHRARNATRVLRPGIVAA